MYKVGSAAQDINKCQVYVGINGFWLYIFIYYLKNNLIYRKLEV